MSERRLGAGVDPRPSEPVARHRVPIQRTTASARPSPAFRARADDDARIEAQESGAVAVDVIDPVDAETEAPTGTPTVVVPSQRAAPPEAEPNVAPSHAEPDAEAEVEAEFASDPDVTDRPVRRSRLAMAIPLVVCIAALLGALAAGTSLALRGAATTSHRLETPQIAGGMPRDTAQEQAMSAQIQPIRDSFELQFMGRLKTFVSAVYRESSHSPEDPSGPVVFVGATVNTSSNSIDFISAMKASAVHNGFHAVEVSAGPGARAVCLAQAGDTTAAVSSCSWSTGDSIGEVVPTKSGWTVDRLASLMRQVRADVEVSAPK